MRRLAISPFLASFLALFAAAELTLYALGQRDDAIDDLIKACAVGLFCFVTYLLTRSNPDEPQPPPAGRWVGVQIAVCALVIFGLAIEGALGGHIRQAVLAVSQHINAEYAQGITNFILYCVPVAVVLLALGVPIAQLGFGRFRPGSWGSAAVWLVLPLGAFAWIALTGRAPVTSILAIWISNVLQNGFSEEFLWRGAFLGRLRAVMDAERALYLQALLFGLWHFSADIHFFKGNLAATCAEMIAGQMVSGLAFGYVTLRTGNIAIATAFHFLLDSLGDVFG